MTRKKVKLAYISNDAARKATFKKRKKGLMKKVSELSTLCGIEACAIIFSPYDSQPEVWPSPLGVQRVLSHFKNLPEMEQSKKMVNQESFIRQRIVKAAEHLKKQRKDNREKEITQVMYQNLVANTLHNLNMMDLNDLGWVIDQNLKEINKRIETLTEKNHDSKEKVGGGGSSSGGGHHDDQRHHLAGPSSSTAGSSEDYLPQREERPANNNNNVEGNVDQHTLQRQPHWFMDLMNQQDPMGFGGGEEMMQPFGDNNQPHLWSSAFFP
ncbi:hypothetical protein Tsubulata_033152 [Turnera subulata]|uniref:MADS-box domain-containing protein n=1 Tax=Turnera subulata TaxID=218843 RepID=A0A9Q0G0L7_9ROSI|nr:hypothetical protein Tsubulata_033152 [Turnera subulata]